MPKPMGYRKPIPEVSLDVYSRFVAAHPGVEASGAITADGELMVEVVDGDTTAIHFVRNSEIVDVLRGISWRHLDDYIYHLLCCKLEDMRIFA